MLKYAPRRLVLTIPILIGVSIIAFLFVHALPGSPADALLGERGTPEQERQIERELGLDRPLHVQYLRYMRNLVQGDFGTSVRTRRPVSEELSQRFPATFELGVTAI